MPNIICMHLQHVLHLSVKQVEKNIICIEEQLFKYGLQIRCSVNGSFSFYYLEVYTKIFRKLNSIGDIF